MKKNVDFFLACTSTATLDNRIRQITAVAAVEHLYLLCPSSLAADVANILKDGADNDKIVLLQVDNFTAMKLLRSIAKRSTARYTAIFLKPVELEVGYRCIERMIAVAEDTKAAMVYSDRYETKDGVTSPHPVIDYQPGSLRDDFDFGGLWLLRTEMLHSFVHDEASTRWRFSGPYALRLYISRHGLIFHLKEPLYTEVEPDLRRSGEKQFDYVNPAAREIQLEYERVVTAHLKQIGAWLSPEEFDELPKLSPDDYPVTATVVIPVRNRQRTISDAIRSVLDQKTSFPFNVIVVDNHSTDGTTEVIASFSNDPRVIALTPVRTDLGIGGCWDMAIRDSRCGQYAVQLDSDDLYSSPFTLAAIVDAFSHQNAAMVIGAYRMVDFALNTLPPGLIAHTEWTPDNGRNNALRINGLGAPRAFRTDILRKIGFPNTSYGEDYALGLTISRRYRIGRIYDELYLCRRWEGNSDAALSVEQVNRHNYYKDSLRTIEVLARQALISRWNRHATQTDVLAFFDKQLQHWLEVKVRFNDLNDKIQTRQLVYEDYTLAVQYNPCRIGSTAAKVDKRNLKRRPCFLCDHNRPPEQKDLSVEGQYQILVNPFPILPHHLTIPSRRHRPQRLAPMLNALTSLAWRMPDFLLFYNGGRCGASAPDHAHLQAGERGVVPLERDWKFYENRLEKLYPLTSADEAELEELGYKAMHVGVYLLKGYACPAFVVVGENANVEDSCKASGDHFLLQTLIQALPIEAGQAEPDFNLLAWRQKGGPANADSVVSVLFPRRKHRPDCYFATGDTQILVSPGALDMAGLIITPRQEDFIKLTESAATNILREVTLTERQVLQVAKRLHTERSSRPQPSVTDTASLLTDEPEVSVGILCESHVAFTLNGTFTAKGAEVTGPQKATIQDGAILWNGNVYSELTFHPMPSTGASASPSFTIEAVTIGVNFHWQRQERQTFGGALKIIVYEDKLVVINRIPVEAYLASVISSEMSATSSPELLKAHAVVSRSWLFYQMQMRRTSQHRDSGSFFSFVRKDDEYIKWYDREDHSLFDVCADDHCQRYQGLTRAANPAVLDAVAQTRGMVLTDTDGHLCDARFSKCCGGTTERFSTCWGANDVEYLTPIRDAHDAAPVDLSDEQAATDWILSEPNAFCNTHDKALLKQVLNDYDRETQDFYRWHVSYTQTELAEIIRTRREEDFGDIVDLIPIERGASGRLKRLKIVGTKKTLIIGKELEIRRSLSSSHLLSSAFVVEKTDIVDGIPQRFTLHGAGWGHGVGLCQIGAAAMSHDGYDYTQILRHYYTGAGIKQLYK